MCCGLLVFFAGWLLPAGASFGQISATQQSAKSVVKITCKTGGGAASATGFVWSKSTYVVTALHAVAGCNKITVYSESQKDETDAVVIAAYKEADLALLRLETDLQLQPLISTPADPVYSDEYYIWGYPRDVATMQGDDIKFSMSLTRSPTLRSIFKSPAQFEKTVGAQGYPQLNAKILRVSSIIQPGHSGAPIFDKSGRVIGIADGGLREGIARINWAVPAKVYLAGLENSTDAIPGTASIQNTLFRSPAAAAEIKFTPAGKPATAPGDMPMHTEGTLHLAWSTTLAEIVHNLPDEDAEIYNELIAQAREETGRDLGQAMIAVYEDFETGATIAVPDGIELLYDPEDKMLEAWSASDRLEMIVQIYENDTWDQAMNVMKDFEEYLVAGESWQPDPELKDLLENDPQAGYSYASKSRLLRDDAGAVQSRMHTTLIIDQQDFLGTAVIIHDPAALTGDELINMYLMTICVELANFSIE